MAGGKESEDSIVCMDISRVLEGYMRVERNDIKRVKEEKAPAKLQDI